MSDFIGGAIAVQNNWKECKLGDVVSSNNKTVDKNYEFENIQYLDTGSLTNNKIDGFQEFKISDAPSRAKRLIKHQDIVYSTVRPIQRHFGFIENPQENLVVSTGFSVIETNQKLAYPKFIYYFLSSDETVEILDVIAEASTSAYPSLKPSDIENLDISLPPLEEQKAIAEVLSSLDDKIDLLHRQNQTLESLAQTLFRQWFIEEAKEEWEVGILGDYIDIVDNRGKTPPFLDDETEYPIIEVNALSGQSRLINYSVIKKYVTEETYNSWFRAGHPKLYDTLLSTVGSIGEIAMFLLEKGSIAQNVVALRAKNISPFYLYENIKFMQNELKELDIGSVQPSIKVTHLVKVDFVKPDDEILKKFDEQMMSISNKIIINSQQIKTLENFRDTLLPKLLSGEVRI